MYDGSPSMIWPLLVHIATILHSVMLEFHFLKSLRINIEPPSLKFEN